MNTLAINVKHPEKKIIDQAVQIIKDGGVVVYPTDTAYGLAANAVDERAIGKLFIIKQRVQKPLPVIVSSVTMLKTIAEVTPQERKLADTYWPGPVTFLFKKKASVPPFLTLGLPTIGARIPDSPVACALVKACGFPLTSTSANLSGRGNCYTTECVIRMFQDAESQPDLVLDAGELPEVPVSTVVRVENKKVVTIRKGPVEVTL